MKKIKILTVLALVSVFPVMADHSPDHLPQPVEQMLKKFRVPEKSLSLYIKEHNASEPLAAPVPCERNLLANSPYITGERTETY